MTGLDRDYQMASLGLVTRKMVVSSYFSNLSGIRDPNNHQPQPTVLGDYWNAEYQQNFFLILLHL